MTPAETRTPHRLFCSVNKTEVDQTKLHRFTRHLEPQCHLEVVETELVKVLDFVLRHQKTGSEPVRVDLLWILSGGGPTELIAHR
jgi:hypothetical protein